MNLIFAGTPVFAAASLTALEAAGHQIVLVLTRPDRRSGRGMRLTQSPTAEIATKMGMRVEKPATLKDPVTQELLRSVTADAMVVAAYGLLLPQAVLDIPALGCFNVHGSLLPRWRGAAPVQRAIEAGDTATGISIMKMDVGLDTGPVLLGASIPILPDDTSGSLFSRLTELGAKTIVAALAQIDTLQPQAQSQSGITYARKVEKSEATMDWTQPADELERRIRAFDPSPGMEARLDDQPFKIWRAEVSALDEQSKTAHPGKIVAITPNHINIQCGRGILALKVIQKPGGKRLQVADFLRNQGIKPGMVFT